MNEDEFQSLPKFGRVDQEQRYLEEIARLTAELAKFQESEFHPNWSLLAACRENLREYRQGWKHCQEELAASQERERVLREALEWALGERGEFGEEPEAQKIGELTLQRRYWWRKELRQRAQMG